MGVAEDKETERLTALLARAERDPAVLAVILFGSRARGENTPDSDIDICLVLEPRSYSDLELSEKKLDYLAEFDLDIHIYQQLPLYIRPRVLREGKVLFCRNEDTLYELAFRTIQEYEDFKHIYRDTSRRLPMAKLDTPRILAKLDALEGYLEELKSILPLDFEEYQRNFERRRACECLLQISIETVIDVCSLLVKGMRLGLPGEEDDLFDKLHRAGVISEHMRDKLRKMKGLRNILVHEYARVDDRLVYGALWERLHDFAQFKHEILGFLKEQGNTMGIRK
jgi:hypothetical protein